MVSFGFVPCACATTVPTSKAMIIVAALRINFFSHRLSDDPGRLFSTYMYPSPDTSPPAIPVVSKTKNMKGNPPLRTATTPKTIPPRFRQLIATAAHRSSERNSLKANSAVTLQFGKSSYAGPAFFERARLTNE